MSWRRYLKKKFRLTNILPSVYICQRTRSTESFCHHRIYETDQLPPKVDLRPDMTPVENQLNLGSSVAECLAGAYEYLTQKSNECNVGISRLFIYYNARALRNRTEPITDSGCSLSSGIESLEEFGACLETVWSYDAARVNIRPSAEAYLQAEKHKINEASQLSLDLNEMKSCLAEGFPFAFGLRLYSSFDQAAKNGVVTVPTIHEQHRPPVGGHAMLAVGYSDRSGAFIVRNSWDDNWGDKGYCYVPYDYMTNPNLCFDLWTIRKVANDSFGREYWHFDDIVDYLNDGDYSTDSDNRTSWKDHRDHRRVIGDVWDEYRGYQRSPQYDDDYVHHRYRRDRYDRDNDPYAQRSAGYTNNGFSPNKIFTPPFLDRDRDRNNYHTDCDADRLANSHQHFLF